MAALHRLRRSQRVIALAVAVWLLVGSFCPRDWFLCLHDDGAMALVDGEHADAHAEASGHDSGHDCCLSDDGCLDLPVSLTLDLQHHAHVLATVLPVPLVIDVLVDPRARTASSRHGPRPAAGEAPSRCFAQHIRLLV